MLNLIEGSVFTNGIHIHYYRSTPPPKQTRSLLSRTRPAPSLILLHGVTDSSLCWKHVAEDLHEDYDLVMPDSRGHGLTDAPETGYGVGERAADLAGLINELHLDQPILLGHSMGAETAIGTAGLYPDLVRAVILEDPPWPGRSWGSTPEERAERAAEWAADITQQKQMTHAQMLAEVQQKHPNWPPEELEPWIESKQQVSPHISKATLAPRRRWTDYVHEARCSILLITADVELGAIVSSQTAEEAAFHWRLDNAPGGLVRRVVHTPGAGHSIHREQYEPYMKAVKRFLSQVTH